MQYYVIDVINNFDKKWKTIVNKGLIEHSFNGWNKSQNWLTLLLVKHKT